MEQYYTPTHVTGASPRMTQSFEVEQITFVFHGSATTLLRSGDPEVLVYAEAPPVSGCLNCWLLAIPQGFVGPREASQTTACKGAPVGCVLSWRHTLGCRRARVRQ